MASLDREAGVVAPLSQCKPNGYLLSRPPVTTLALHSEVRPTWPCTLFDLNGCPKRPAQHLRRALREYVQYFNDARPHQGIQQRIPTSSEPTHLVHGHGAVQAIPILGGLHHDYRRVA